MPVGSAREHGGAVSRVDQRLLLPRAAATARDDASVDDVHQRVRAESGAEPRRR